MKSILMLFLLTLNSCAIVDYFDGSCEYKGKTYEDGETFQDQCQNYSCEDGKVSQGIVECVEL